VREAAETFASKLFPRGTKLVRTEPLKALVVGAFVRGLSMRDVESLCEQAGLGKLSRSTASRICEHLRERYEAFKRRDLYEVRLVALFLDATYLAVRPDGPKEGPGRLGLQRRRRARAALGDAGDARIARGLAGARARSDRPRTRSAAADRRRRRPGLIKAIEQCWPASDRQRCCVHRARNLYAKLPERERERVKQAYWRALDDAISESDAKQRLGALVDELDKGGSPPRPDASPTTSTRSSFTWLPTQTPPAVAVNQSARKVTRRGQKADQGDGPLPRRAKLPVARLGHPRPPDHPRNQRHPLQPARPPTPQADELRGTSEDDSRGGDSRLD
jgi:hypothetical protein